MIGALGRLLVERLERSAGLVDDGASPPVTASALPDGAARIAQALQAGGLQADEPVFLVVAGRAVDLEGLLGVWMAGGVAAPIHASASPATWSAARRVLGARVVIDRAGVSFEGRAAPAPQPTLAGAALVVFTSGTTGLPKCVVIRHQGFVGKLEALDPVIRFTPDDLVVVPLQLTFIFGQWVALLALSAGSSVALMPRFSPEACHRSWIRDATALGAVPSMLRALAQGPRPFDRLRTIISGGESLGMKLSVSTAARWPNASIFDMYGLTETGAADFCSVSTVDRPAGAWIGRPTGGVSYRLVAQDGSVVARGAAGELQIRTRHGMAGYLGDPCLTAKSFREGWFRTGDLAVEDADGRLRLVGRIKDLISRAGNKIYPAEVENALQLHPDVAACLCAGVPDEAVGERIHAAVVLKTRSVETGASLRSWLAGRLERYKIPDFISVIESIPLGPTGKASRAALRELVESRHR
ncbi:class I adenylate-forming enzyme family protein [Hansschlegelia zhihuaiae]|uniref:Long-chain fatty acid--CoA ligase n=1 Tax=Hansschlegelia zhihuaiae TaxID=405005 RepID=A0A4Q0MPD4_9HYPH|nr:class I adenylate-forming enzyme family protein [Hansschlegelia zhihuaiae]RXF75624.1 long-chain fatty acid--CoA ligase [Hansschlegelia zhihuaiae]